MLLLELLNLDEDLFLALVHSLDHGDLIQDVVDHHQIRCFLLNRFREVGFHLPENILVLAVAAGDSATLQFVSEGQ